MEQRFSGIEQKVAWSGAPVWACGKKEVLGLSQHSLCLFFFWLFRASPEAYGDSQARGRRGAVAAGLHHSHSNAGSELHLRPTPQLMAMPDPYNPLSEGRDGTGNLMVPSGIPFHCATMGTPLSILINSGIHGPLEL